MRLTAVAILIALIASSCETKEHRKVEFPKKPSKPFIALDSVPSFRSDSAFVFVENQVAFGPRVPNSSSHKKCADYLESELGRFGLETNVQQAQVTAFNGDVLNIKNIEGRLLPELEERILLFAHWDTRPFADRDTERRNKAIDGANDGASGVAVILELMRSIQAYPKKPAVGIDVVFFDAEDYGKPSSSMTGEGSDSWCLGSQYWSVNLPADYQKPKYGVLLDMVGAANAVFPKEYASRQYARPLQDKIWKLANDLGHGKLFINEAIGGITDDHIYVNQLAEIPSIDIIHYEPWRSDFGSFHHTHGDDLEGISAQTLGAAGEVLIEFLYRE